MDINARGSHRVILLGGWHHHFHLRPDMDACFFSPFMLNMDIKGDVITVIRRVDENWLEGRLGDKSGVFPVRVTEVSLGVSSAVWGNINPAFPAP